MFCSACGNSVIDTAVICPSCGSPVKREGNSKVVKIIGWIGAIVMPIIGLISAIILLVKKEYGHGLSMLAVTIVMWFFWMTFWAPSPSYYL